MERIIAILVEDKWFKASVLIDGSVHSILNNNGEHSFQFENIWNKKRSKKTILKDIVACAAKQYGIEVNGVIWVVSVHMTQMNLMKLAQASVECKICNYRFMYHSEAQILSMMYQNEITDTSGVQAVITGCDGKSETAVYTYSDGVLEILGIHDFCVLWSTFEEKGLGGWIDNSIEVKVCGVVSSDSQQMSNYLKNAVRIPYDPIIGAAFYCGTLMGDPGFEDKLLLSVHQPAVKVEDVYLLPQNMTVPLKRSIMIKPKDTVEIIFESLGKENESFMLDISGLKGKKVEVMIDINANKGGIRIKFKDKMENQVVFMSNIPAFYKKPYSRKIVQSK